MEYELEMEVAERIQMPDFSPEKTNGQTRYMMRDILDKTLIGPEEAKEIELLSKILPDGRLGHQWNREKVKPVIVTYSQAEMEFLKDRAKEMDAKAEIRDETLNLWGKIKGAEPTEGGSEG